MRIVVCIKQVPATTDAKIDPETKRIIREGTKAVMNPFDLYAVEEALRIRERCGGEIVALTMGPESAKNVLIEALSMGADRAVLLCDRGFAGSDTWATSYALSRAIETLGGADLIICGKQAVDGDTAQVGPGIAAKLDILQAANVSKVEEIGADHIIVSRMNETGYDVLKLRFPALLTVIKDINVPRIPTLRNARKARTAKITVWKPEDIGAEQDKIGLAASPTRVVKTEPPAVRSTATVKIEGEPEEAAKALTAELFRQGLIRTERKGGNV